MLHQVALIDPSGVPILLITIGKEIISEEQFSLYSGLISALNSFGESLIGKPQTINFGDYILAMFLISIDNKSIFVVGIADATDRLEAVKRTITLIANRIHGVLQQVAPASGLVILDEKITKKINEIVNETIRERRRILPYLRKGGKLGVAFGTLIGLLTSFTIYYFCSIIINALFQLFVRIGLETIAVELSNVIFTSVWCLITGIITGISTGKARGGAVASYIAIFLTVLTIIYVAPQGARNILAIVGTLVAWSPFAAISGYISGELLDRKKLT